MVWLRWPELGQGLVEYAMSLLLIAVVAVTLFGGRVSTLYAEVDCRVEGVVEHTGPSCP